MSASFDFDAAASVTAYVAALGCSHLYLSPILQAAPGSTHGYDTVDHGRISDELGGRSGFDRLSRAAAAHDLSLVVDIVPNHMALAGSANQWWWDVLEEGPASEYAGHFDIDWWSGSDDNGPSVLLPVLGDDYGRVLEAGDLVVVREGGAFLVHYFDHELPVSARTLGPQLHAAAEAAPSRELSALVWRFVDEGSLDPRGFRHELRELLAARPAIAEAVDAALAALNGDLDALDTLLSGQSYRLAHWKVANDEVDYRRFFDITTLIGVRVDDPVVFEATHRLVLDLVANGEVGGLRVDHIDGLRDPAGYLRRLRAEAPNAWIVVEKILGPDEVVPSSWPVAGTTGYDFAAHVNDVFVDPDGAQLLREHFARCTGEPVAFDDVACAAQRAVLGLELAAEVERVTGLLAGVCRKRRRHRDHTLRELRTLVIETATAMPVYRTYVRPSTGAGDVDRERVADAIALVAGRAGDVDGELLELWARVLLLDEPGDDVVELAVRFQQLTAPVMAKGVEDTAFYRWVPHVASNEVGSDPGQAGREVGPFHAYIAATAASWPSTMLALSTHDTKRSADVRARLNGLTEIPTEWIGVIDRWCSRNAGHHGSWDDPSMELLLYQTLVGAWPIAVDRIEAAMVKSANEAKFHTSWARPNEGYLDGLRAFVRAVLGDRAFVDDLQRFLADHDLVERGRTTSLAQLTLALTSPGVPDIYQGDELWDLSLVDPDNRRAVDFDARQRLLVEVAAADPEEALALADVGAPKLWLVRRLLQHRRAEPGRYEGGSYRPLVARGARADHVVAFAREGLVVVVPRLVAGIADGWCDTSIALPDGEWRSVLIDGETHSGVCSVAALFARFPAVVLAQEGP